MHVASPYRLAVLGAAGSGKTTCVAALSRSTPPGTGIGDLATLLRHEARQRASLDYGELTLEDGTHLQVFGLPEPPHFRGMFEAMRDTLVGTVVMADAASHACLEGLERILANYADLLREGVCVLALNRSRNAPAGLRGACRQKLLDHGVSAPVMAVDARRRADMVDIAKLMFTRHGPRSFATMPETEEAT